MPSQLENVQKARKEERLIQGSPPREAYSLEPTRVLFVGVRQQRSNEIVCQKGRKLVN